MYTPDVLNIMRDAKKLSCKSRIPYYRPKFDLRCAARGFGGLQELISKNLCAALEFGAKEAKITEGTPLKCRKEGNNHEVYRF
jgi:hypothetical protein